MFAVKRTTKENFMFSFISKLFKQKTTEPGKSVEFVKTTGTLKPPSKNQLEECERIGLEVKPNMTSRDVWQLVQDAIQKPEIKKLYDAYISEQNAILEADDRDEYGDALIDKLNKWKKGCDGKQYLVVFKKGKTLDSDVLEFECANIVDDQKPYITIEGLRPRIYRPRDESPYIEWEKEISFRTTQILEIKKLPQSIDMFDIEAYEKMLLHAKEMEAKHQ